MQRIGNATGKPISKDSPALNTTFQGLRFEGVMGIGGANSRLTVRRVKE